MDKTDLITKLKIVKQSYINDNEIVSLIDNCDLNLELDQLEIEYSKIIQVIHNKHRNDIVKGNYQLLKLFNTSNESVKFDENPTEEKMFSFFIEILDKLSFSQLKYMFETLFKLTNLTEEQVNTMKLLLLEEKDEKDKKFGDTKLYTYIQNI